MARPPVARFVADGDCLEVRSVRHGEQDSAVDDWADLPLGRYVYQ